MEIAINNYYHENALAFIVFDKQEDTYAGTTRFTNISWKNKVLEIGSTWIGREFQGTGLNKNMKFLMLQYAFETLNFDKVAFHVNERNIRSRKSVEKIGSKLGDVLRKDTLMLDGFKRNTCYYGILKEQWKEIRLKILKNCIKNWK